MPKWESCTRVKWLQEAVLNGVSKATLAGEIMKDALKFTVDESSKYPVTELPKLINIATKALKQLSAKPKPSILCSIFVEAQKRASDPQLKALGAKI